jgi:hypothetical protein
MHTKCQAFNPVARIGFPHPLARKELSLTPHFGSKGGDTLARGKGGGGTLFRGRDRHSGTLVFVIVTYLGILKDDLHFRKIH